MGTQGLKKFQTLDKVWRTTIAPRASVFLFFATAAIISGCSPSIRSPASTLSTNTISANENVFNDHLVVVSQPTDALVNSAISPAIEVEFVDSAGQVDTTINSLVSIAIGTNPSAGILNGTTTVSAVDGVATFSTLNINSGGNGYTLEISAANVTSAPTTAFNILSGTPTQLVFSTEPSSAASGASLGNISVEIEDASGNLETSSALPVTLAIGNNAGPGGVLSGTLTVNAVNGIATFPGLSINLAGTGYTLIAASSGLTGATSSAFNITYLTPTSFTWSGSTSISSGSCQAYTIQAMNGVYSAAFGTVTPVSLTGAGSGSFYGPGDSSCGTPVASVSFGVNVSSVTIYYKNPAVGTVNLTSTAGSATGSYSVNSTGRYVLSSNVSTISVGGIVTMTISLENSSGATIIAPSNITFNLWNGGYFNKFCGTTDPTCANAAVTSVTIPSGSSSISYYFQDYRAETTNPNATDTSGLFNGSPSYVTLTIQPNSVSAGGIVVTGPTFVTPGTCAAYTATVTDSYGNISPLSSAQTFALATSAGGQFYGTSDTGCSSSTVTTVPIASGASSVVFHFMDSTVPDSPTIGATDSGFTTTTFAANSVTSIPAITLGGGDYTSCTIVNGDLQCWGDNASAGVVGNGAITGDVTLPSQVLGLSSGVTSVSESWAIACATANGGQYCWSGNGFGDTGGAAGEGYNYPGAATGFGAGTGVTQTAVGPGTGGTSCILVDGGVYCTGSNYAGSLGNGTTSGSSGGVYVQVPAFPQGSGITKLYGAQDGYCVIINGGAECWGGNGFTATPTYQIAQGSGVSTLGLVRDNSYAVIGGQIYMMNGVGSYSLFQGGAVTGVTKIAGGYEQACALTSIGTVYCWTYGSVPTQIPGITGAIDVSAEASSGCALFSDSEQKCWGTNGAGNLGTGTITDSPTTPLDTGSIYGGIARVNQGAWGNLPVSGNTVTQSLGWTVGSNNFFVLEVGGAGSGSAISSVVAYAGSTPYTMTQGASISNNRAIALYYLPDASAITSVTINYVANNGAYVDVAAAEYSGMSTTASVVSSAVTADSGYTGSTTWSAGAYTAAVGGLVLSGATDGNFGNSETASAGLGWNLVASDVGGGASGVNIMLEEQLKTAGSCTGTGTFSWVGDRYYDSFIVGFK